MKKKTDDRMERTFVLMWNPEVSSFKTETWHWVMEHRPFVPTLNWSVWDHEKVEVYDRFFMVKVGSGKTGVVMHGCMDSMPRRGEDWTGQGREVFYCNLYVMQMLDAETQPIITTEALERAIPGFDWRGGHSGRLLNEDETRALNTLWDKFCKENRALMDEQDRRNELCIDKRVAGRIEGFEHLVNHFRRCWGDAYKENPDVVFEKDTYHDSMNLGFRCDYEAHVFELKFLIQDDYMKITCGGLRSVKMNLTDECLSQGWFRIYDDKGLIHLEANDIEVVCEKMTFGRVLPFKGESIPATI